MTGLQLAVLLSVLTLLADAVGAAQAHSIVLAISAVQSAGQVLTAGAALLVARHGPASAASPPPFDPSRVAALAGLLSGLALLVLSMPIAYRALGSLFLPGECDTAESACILVLGLCSSGASVWLILRAGPRSGPTDAPDAGRGSFAGLVAGHLVDVQASALMLAAVLVSALSGWVWIDALAGLTGSFFMSVAAARLVVGTGAKLVEA